METYGMGERNGKGGNTLSVSTFRVLKIGSTTLFNIKSAQP